MGIIYPQNFTELIIIITFLSGLFFIFFSIRQDSRPFSLKVSAILLIVALVLFSKNSWCYFASIFIIATAVTELEFLQNLAAIIRGSDAYFNYKKEFSSATKIEESIKAKFEEAEKEIDKEFLPKGEITFPLDKNRLSMGQVYIIAEELAFRHLERRENKTVSRHVQFTGGGSSVLFFDGVIEGEKIDTLIEIIIPRYELETEKLFKNKMSQLVSAMSYQALTKRSAELKIIIIGKLRENKMAEFRETAKKMIQTGKMNIQFSLELLSYDEIGLKSK